jgi:virulence-associated protein VagC
MRAVVSKEGVLIPKRLLRKGVTKVDIQRDGTALLVRPVPAARDAVWKLGSWPVRTGIKDGSDRHDEYLYSGRSVTQGRLALFCSASR